MIVDYFTLNGIIVMHHHPFRRTAVQAIIDKSTPQGEENIENPSGWDYDKVTLGNVLSGSQLI